jgi:hypothetical protein
MHMFVCACVYVPGTESSMHEQICRCLPLFAIHLISDSLSAKFVTGNDDVGEGVTSRRRLNPRCKKRLSRAQR